jgi:hypothetical protein
LSAEKTVDGEAAIWFVMLASRLLNGEEDAEGFNIVGYVVSKMYCRSSGLRNHLKIYYGAAAQKE